MDQHQDQPLNLTVIYAKGAQALFTQRGYISQPLTALAERMETEGCDAVAQGDVAGRDFCVGNSMIYFRSVKYVCPVACGCDGSGLPGQKRDLSTVSAVESGVRLSGHWTAMARKCDLCEGQAALNDTKFAPHGAAGNGAPVFLSEEGDLYLYHGPRCEAGHSGIRTPTVDIGAEVKAEGDDSVDTTQQVLDILGVQSEVADIVATDQPTTAEASRPFLEPETSADVEPTQAFDDIDIAKEEAFDDIDIAKEEVDFAPTEEPSGVSELATEVETTDILGLGEDPSVGAETSVEASETVASVPEPEVAENLATDPADDLAAPPTSPNLVPPGVEPL
eukprot:s5332_g4.t1